VIPDEFHSPLSAPEDYKPGVHPHYDLWRQIQRREEVWGPLIEHHALNGRVKILNVSFTDPRQALMLQALSFSSYIEKSGVQSL